MNTYNIEHNGTMLSQVPLDKLTAQLQMQGLIVSLPHEIQNLLSQCKVEDYLVALCERMEEDIKYSDAGLDDVSWGMQYGVLISIREANQIVSLLRRLQKLSL